MRFSLLLFVMLGVTCAAIAVPRDAWADADKPPVSIILARKVALTRVPGTIVNEKLKKAKKKKDLPPIWSIKIRPRGAADSDRLVKVEIDANTASILKVKDVKARDSE